MEHKEWFVWDYGEYLRAQSGASRYCGWRRFTELLQAQAEIALSFRKERKHSAKAMLPLDSYLSRPTIPADVG